MKNYVKNDLIDYADVENIDRSGYTSSRSTLLKESLGLSDRELKSYTYGSYQGTMLFVFEVGGYIWLLRDSYGSCSYCDGLLGSSDVRTYATSMMNNAYCFESKNDAVRFLNQVLDARDKDKEDRDLDLNPYFWDSVAVKGIELLNEL